MSKHPNAKFTTTLLAALFLALAGCRNELQNTPDPYGDGYTPVGGAGSQHPLPSANTQPAPFELRTPTDRPELARVVTPKPGNPRLKTLGIPNGAPTRVKLKLLVIAATEDESGLSALKTFLPQIGVPFDTLIATQTDLTAQTLEAEPGLGNYNGVILTTAGLSYYDGSAWASALDANEWSLLRQYEADYRVREVQYFSFPDGAGTGMSWNSVASGTPNTMTLTTDGRSVFGYLKTNAQIPLKDTYTYFGTPVGNAKPLLTTPEGTVAATTSWPDGRESLSMTMAHNYYLTHSSVLTYGLVRWVSRGVFLGEKKMYFSAHIDDYFLPNDTWDVNLKRNNLSFRLRPTDLQSTASWQTSFRTRFPTFAGFKFELFYNGLGFTPQAVSNCNPAANSIDPLTSKSKCLKSNFYWGNHTYTHLFITNPAGPGPYTTFPPDPNNPGQTEDSFSLSRMNYELGDNIKIAGPTGLNLNANDFDAGTLVTGSHSGIGYYDYEGPEDNVGGPPDIPAAKINEGKSKSNPNLVTAMNTNAIRYLGANTSAPTTAPLCTSSAADCNQNNPSPNAGVWLTGPNLPQNSVLLVPRYPVNIFYNVDTIAREVDEYNHIFASFWAQYGRTTPLTWDEILTLESDAALMRIISGSMNPHYFHQINLRFENGSSLLTAFVDAVGQKYNAMFDLPIQNLKMTKIGDRMRARMAYDASGAQAIWNRTTGTVTVTANSTAQIPLTNPTLGTVYGPDRVVSTTNGQTLTVGTGL
jgi:hypothetical protein